MGICNGFQILTEAKLLPGALLHNTSRKFICKNVYLKAETKSSILTQQLSDSKAYKVPIAHGEGNFYASQDVIHQLEDNHQILFRYCNADGMVDESANPNGSVHNIAGVTNAKRNVFGMMPHPERCTDFELSNTDGRLIFESLLNLLPA
jgi:phosphoribosylformylglycinamidine synthase